MDKLAVFKFLNRWDALRFWLTHTWVTFRQYVCKMELFGRINPDDWVGIVGSVDNGDSGEEK